MDPEFQAAQAEILKPRRTRRRTKEIVEEIAAAHDVSEETVDTAEEEAPEPLQGLALLQDFFSRVTGRWYTQPNTRKAQGRAIHRARLEAQKAHPEPRGARRRRHWAQMDMLESNRRTQLFPPIRGKRGVR